MARCRRHYNNFRRILLRSPPVARILAIFSACVLLASSTVTVWRKALSVQSLAMHRQALEATWEMMSECLLKATWN